MLDGAVLLLSAVEGVQARTRVLMRALRRLRLPTLVFVNKIDRSGARADGLLDDVRRLLTPHVAPLTEVTGAGTAHARVARRPPDGRTAEALAEVDPGILGALVDGPEPTPRDLAAALAARTADGSFHPLFHGSALGGQGVAELVEGLVTLVPTAAGETAAGTPEPRGTVFAVRPGPGGERRAYLRLYAGEVRPRRRLTFLRRESDGRTTEVSGRVTRLDVVGGDATLTAGNIAALTVPGGLRVGDRLGEPADRAPRFAPPTLRTLVWARRPEQATPLRSALLALADGDPLLHARPAASGATELLLYGEVQMEVLAATLAEEFGIEAEFAPGRVRLLERPAGTGEAAEETPWLEHTRYWATIGLRVEPGPHGSGAVFGYETELGALPRAFHQAVEETVHAALAAGLTGAAVTDCRVTLIRSGFDSVLSTAADFRRLTPIVLHRALTRAGTVLYEPYLAFEAEVPPHALAAVTALLASLGADVTGTAGGDPAWIVTGELPARRAREAELRLPGLTRGEAVWSARPSADRPVKTGR